MRTPSCSQQWGSTAVGLSFCVAAAMACGPDRLRLLESSLVDRIAETNAEVVAVYLRDLGSGDTLAIDAGIVLHAASMMKVSVMIQVFRDVDANRIGLDDELTVTNSFRSVVDGSLYLLSAGEDSDATLYVRLGAKATVRELVELMITVSSNLATNILIEHLGADRIQLLNQELGAHSMMLIRGVEDIKAYEAGISNRTTASDMGSLFEAIAERRAASDSSCRQMIEILARQQFNDGIPAGIPKSARVAHKTGMITRINHDGGIVFTDAGKSYVFVVLTSGIDDPAVSDQLIADLSTIAYRSVTTN
jgi:beta-lactamase class A